MNEKAKSRWASSPLTYESPLLAGEAEEAYFTSLRARGCCVFSEITCAELVA
jgi:hypothetical protein